MGMIGYFFSAEEAEIAQAQNDTRSFYELAFSAGEEESVDVDKAWHAIHFVLSGNPWDCSQDDPLSQAVLYGTPIGENMGYGPAMLKTAAEVKQIAQALSLITKEWFHDHYSIADMIEEHIYPVREEEDGEEFFAYIWGAFLCLQDFYQKASAKERCVLFYIS